jgi:hypothetical protein
MTRAPASSRNESDAPVGFADYSAMRALRTVGPALRLQECSRRVRIIESGLPADAELGAVGLGHISIMPFRHSGLIEEAWRAL